MRKIELSGSFTEGIPARKYLEAGRIDEALRFSHSLTDSELKILLLVEIAQSITDLDRYIKILKDAETFIPEVEPRTERVQLSIAKAFAIKGMLSEAIRVVGNWYKRDSFIENTISISFALSQKDKTAIRFALSNIDASKTSYSHKAWLLIELSEAWIAIGEQKKVQETIHSAIDAALDIRGAEEASYLRGSILRDIVHLIAQTDNKVELDYLLSKINFEREYAFREHPELLIAE